MQQENAPKGNDRSIGDIIAQAQNLSPDQVAQVVSYQQEHDVKFGEAAVALGYAKREDVLWALSQQFHYPYAAEGSVTTSAELVVATQPFDASAEFFRDIRSQLISNVLGAGEERCALAICSPNAGDGKSYFAANLAAAFSQLGGRTVLVDADMRTPRQHEIFGIENSASGLSSILAGRAETNVIRPVNALPSLYLLPVGVVPPNPLELVQRPAFDLLIAELLRKFDYVVVDTPAASHGADARVTAAKCGAALALGRKGVTQARDMEALTLALRKGCARFAGAVLNEHR
ncbi:MAG: polysaccharide biosynthesis tyrosine autokinase [Rubrivivax sp.]|nr:MAG: polysaccharide biosynthesis tyrosine autokinase [Rubrivivax sp.]